MPHAVLKQPGKGNVGDADRAAILQSSSSTKWFGSNIADISSDFVEGPSLGTFQHFFSIV